MTTISEVRAAMNMLTDQDLGDDVISLAITRATAYVDMLSQWSRADESMVTSAVLNYAAYLAYQAYSDRVLNLISGTLGEDGLYTPEGLVIQRDVMNKLADMKANSERSLNWLRAFGPANTVVRPGFIV
jgi:hypothetical protein